MPNIFRSSRLTLQQRLAQHTGHDIQIEAEGFSSEAGELQNVGKRFIRVNDQYFIPLSLHEIVLLGKNPPAKAEPAIVRTTYRGTISGQLVRTGTDFIELLIPTSGEEEVDWTLIPLTNVISIEKG